jgi:CRAL/TRIO domain
LLPFPYPKSDGSRVVVLRWGAYNTEKFTLEKMIKTITMITDIIAFEDDSSIVGGQTLLFDFKDTTLAHFIQIKPTLLKKIKVMWQDASPVRQKGLHFINTTPGFDQTLTFLKGLLNEKIKSRVSWF